MAKIELHNAIIGIAHGSTWDTAVQATHRLRVQSFVVNDSTDVRKSQNHDLGYFPRKTQQGRRNVSGSITVDCDLGGEWLMLLSSLMGTATASPTEVNSGEGDYLHNFDMAANHTKFMSFAWKMEDDVVGQINSAKLSGVSFQGTENGPLIATFNWIGSRMVHTSTATSIANLDALSFTQPQCPIIFNGSSTYLRYADRSTSTALDSDDNVPWSSFQFDLQRPITGYTAVRGADTQITYEPVPSALGVANFSFSLPFIDDGEIDLFAKYLAGASGTIGMAEIFVDGEQIASGANTSLKIQIPYANVLAVSGFGVTGNAGFATPGLQTDLGKLASSDTDTAGMTGVDGPARFVTVDQRSAAYVS